jgi:uncharacterized protein (TIGR00297 family)
LIIYTAHYACCLGDTFASELGILSKGKPRLLGFLRQVPHGTNGGVSILGTFMSALGGLIIGLSSHSSLILQCPEYVNGLNLIYIGLFSGLFGSFIDSVLGAFFQKTKYNLKSKKIVTGVQLSSNKDEIQDISGFDILSNNQVSFVTYFSYS